MSLRWLKSIISFIDSRLRTFSKVLFFLVGCLIVYHTWNLYLPRKLNFHGLSRFITPSLKQFNAYHNFTRHKDVINASTSQTVLVFLHIQKTGGTLVERGLVKIGLVGRSCLCVKGKRRCPCKTPSGYTWLVSRFSTGWICGLHADMTEYLECLDYQLNVIDERFAERKYAFFTILRNPLDRYISEWLHVRRGGTWHFVRLRCGGQDYSPVHQKSIIAVEGANNISAYRPCYMIPEFRSSPKEGSMMDFVHTLKNRAYHLDWARVSLETFLACPYNLAHNRQTRMLADLSALNCYKNLVNWSIPASSTNALSLEMQRDLRISAKHSLLTRIRVFGLNEHIIYTQYLYYRVLNVVFRQLLSAIPVAPLSMRHTTHAALIRATLNTSELQAIDSRIHLDHALYRFARSLFTRRLSTYLVCDLSIPHTIRRPLRTLWFRHPKLWPGLEYLLLGEPSNPYTPFANRLQKSLIASFRRQGSLPLDQSEEEFVHKKWEDKLAGDFEDAGLFNVVVDSLPEGQTLQGREMHTSPHL